MVFVFTCLLYFDFTEAFDSLAWHSDKPAGEAGTA